MTSSVPASIAADVAAIEQISVVQTILEVVCRTTKLGFAAVARVTPGHWVACAVRDEIAFGLKPGDELEVKSTICDEIRDSGELVVIDHVARDEKFRDHHTPARYGFQSYISVPILLRDGSFFGTLCAIDPRPGSVSAPETIDMFKLFASLIAFHLDAQGRVSSAESALLDERQSTELREQFIAVLGHDLRSPLAAVSASAAALSKIASDERTTNIASIIQRSTARMRGLIDNMMDFARGRLGGGLPLSLSHSGSLQSELQHVIQEGRTTSPHCVIHAEFELAAPVFCDTARVGQLLSNLLANAIAHGDPTQPVRVETRSSEAGFELRVINGGEPIPPAWMPRLFQPFSRASMRPGQQGLGLGLYIAAEIARAHRGTLEADSTAERTCFTFRIPACVR